MNIVRACVVLVALACAGCAGGSRYYASGWDGRRGYDGHGDYGYDVEASRAEARGYGARAERNYPVPGTAGDPWGPYIHEASARFRVPEPWIRGVMRQESGGHQLDSSGSLITSPVGAMGLMQVMPGTYDMLRQRYGLGDDPYEPHDNILAGAAYIREMYDRFGAPGFLAAYNAGPDRLDSYLNGGVPLPDETVNYLASVAPRLGSGTRMTGPLAAYAGGGGGSGGGDAYVQTASEAEDPSYRAFDGGGLVTASAPTGVLTGSRPPVSASPVRSTRPLSPPPGVLAQPGEVPRLVPVAMVASGAGGWGIQVGAYPERSRSAGAIAAARARAPELLAGATPAITTVERGGLLYRARLVGLSGAAAAAACSRLAGAGLDCFTVPPGS